VRKLLGDHDNSWNDATVAIVFAAAFMARGAWLF
jgi:hypothetical protein